MQEGTEKGCSSFGWKCSEKKPAFYAAFFVYATLITGDGAEDFLATVKF
jgi:hypothetical protein